MLKKPVILGIILLFLLVSIFPIMVSSIESQASNIINIDDDKDTDYARINDIGAIICSNNYYLFCNLSINGHVVYAKNQIGIIGNKLDIWFYSEDVTGWDYGFVSIEGILRSHDFRNALVVILYGFNGNISWGNFVEDVNILVEGSAFLVRVAYHGRPL